jgi:hypothetical protein
MLLDPRLLLEPLRSLDLELELLGEPLRGEPTFPDDPLMPPCELCESLGDPFMPSP